MSHERGRDPAPLVSTGRGGAGNLVRSISKGPDESAKGLERGRELRNPSVERATHAGRGGAGNIRSPSRDPKRDAIEVAQEEALQDRILAERRGRQADQPWSAGRGGAGNIRSPSRDPQRDAIQEAQEEALEDRLLAERRGRQADAPFSAGRGGAGNISTSESRSRSRSAVRGGAPADDSPRRDDSRPRVSLGGRHAGRGGYGNITEEGTEDDLARIAEENRYEAEVKKKYEAGEVGKDHSSGRGGAGNTGHSNGHSPVDLAQLSIEERDAFAKVRSRDPPVVRGGRGGAGNIAVHDKGDAASDRGRSGGVIGSMFRSLSRAKRGD